MSSLIMLLGILCIIGSPPSLVWPAIAILGLGVLLRIAVIYLDRP